VSVIMFDTGQALPLVATRLLRPRMSRGVDAQKPRMSSSKQPRLEPIHDHGLATGRAQSRINQKRARVADAFSPRPKSWQRIVRVHEPATEQSSQEQAKAMSSVCPCSVHDAGASSSTNRPLPQTDRESSATRTQAVHRIWVATALPTEFPVHIHHAAAYDLI